MNRSARALIATGGLLGFALLSAALVQGDGAHGDAPIAAYGERFLGNVLTPALDETFPLFDDERPALTWLRAYVRGTADD